MASTSQEGKEDRRRNYAEKVVIPMDELSDDEGLAFWLHWKEECMTYGLKKRLLNTRPGGRAEFHLIKKLGVWNKRHVKQRVDLARYIKGKDKRARRWRKTREQMRWIINHECGRHFHFGHCYCHKCVKIYYVPGSPTMIVVRIKERIYDLRQFDEEARTCLLDMIGKKELTMVVARKSEKRESETMGLPSSRSMYLCQKYNYSQDIVASLKWALED